MAFSQIATSWQQADRTRAARIGSNRYSGLEYIQPKDVVNSFFPRAAELKAMSDGQVPGGQTDGRSMGAGSGLLGGIGAPAQKNSPEEGRVQLAAVRKPGFWGYWGVPGCANCHGYTPDTLPPIGGYSPFPSPVSPRSGNTGGSSPQDDGGKYPQCGMQDRRDREICTIVSRAVV